MHALSALALLNTWERGLTQSSVQRALTLLAAACPEIPVEALARLSIGQRDSLLLTLREWTFGEQIVSVATCPGCGDRLELNFQIADIRVATHAQPAEELSLSVADYKVRFRLPNSQDLDAVATQTPTAAIQQSLLKRCILLASCQGETQTIEQLPPDVVDAVVEQMALADPQAEVLLALACPSCDRQWKSTFDIASFFWSEIHAWAIRTLREIHILASAYGWCEADILAVSPYRRQLYLEMVGK
jgi:hypothetical protein